MTFDWLASLNDVTLIEALFQAGRINNEDRAYWVKLLPRLRSTTPSEKRECKRCDYPNCFCEVKATSECICPTCGIRHGGKSAKGDF